MPCATLLLTALSSRFSSLLITAVALLISPSQKNSSRGMSAAKAADKKAAAAMAAMGLKILCIDALSSLVVVRERPGAGTPNREGAARPHSGILVLMPAARARRLFGKNGNARSGDFHPSKTNGALKAPRRSRRKQRKVRQSPSQGPPGARSSQRPRPRRIGRAPPRGPICRRARA